MTDLATSAARASAGLGPRPTYRPDVDGLRTIALVLVLVVHAFPGSVRGGFVGVDVFFTISGYLITQLLLRGLERDSRPSLAQFYARRIRRILPLGALVVLVTVLATRWAGGTGLGRQAADDGIWAVLGAANLHFAAQADDYFVATDTLSPLLHYWSLGVEEQFYLVWPALILITARLLGRRWVTSMLLALVAASLAWSVISSPSDPVWSFYSPLTRAFELGLGGLLAATAGRWSPTGRGATWLSLAGLGMFAGAAVGFTEQTPWPGWGGLIPCLGTVLFIAAGERGLPAPNRLVAARPLVWAGVRSYGIYLWHWPFLVVPAMVVGQITGPGRVALLVAAVGAAALTYEYFEQPLRHLPALRVRRPRATFAAGFAMVAPVLVAGAVLTHVTPSAPPVTMAAGPTQGEIVGAVRAAQAVHRVPDDLDPPADDIYAAGWLPDSLAGCDTSLTTTEVTADAGSCVAGDPEGDSTMVIWGDSFALQWAPTLDALAKAAHTRLVIFAKYSCPPLTGVVPWYDDKDRPYRECVSYTASVVEEIGRLRPDTVVLTGAARGKWFATPDGQQVGGVFYDDGVYTPTPEAEQYWETGLRASLEVVKAAGAHPVVINDTPSPMVNESDCVALHADDLTPCTIPRVNATFVSHDDAEQQATEDAGGTWVPTTEWFCTDAACPVVIDDIAVYRDSFHITRQYADFLREPLGEAVGLR